MGAPDDDPKKRVLRAFFSSQIPFNKLLGLEVEDFGDGFARLLVPYRPELVGDPVRPALHGGVLSATIDAAGGLAVFSQVEMATDRISTIDLRVDYLRPAALEDVACEARVTRMGNRVASIDAVTFHPTDPDKLIATGKAVYSVRRSS